MAKICPRHPTVELAEAELGANDECDECLLEKARARNTFIVPSVKCQHCSGPVNRVNVAAGDESPYLHRWDLYCQRGCTSAALGWIEFDDSEPAFEHVQQVLDGYTINMRGGRPEGLVYPREGEFANWKAVLRERVVAAKSLVDETPDDMMTSRLRGVRERYKEAKACFEALFGPDGSKEIP